MNSRQALSRNSEERNLLRLSRRQFTLLIPQAALLAACTRPFDERFADELASLEQRVGGRLGVCVHVPSTGMQFGFRTDERFGMCSTFKLALAGLILREIDGGQLTADQFVSYTEDDMVPYAPVTTENLSTGGMTVIALAETVQITSDNVAANLLLGLIGGPEGFTQMLRELGDETTRLDRIEPLMNFVPQGEVRDTTTPRAMAATVAAFVLGDVLTDTSRETLAGWTRATRTGRRRLRAALPEEWRAGDKTGTAYAKGMPNKTNDIAIAWPFDGAMVVTAYYEADGYYDSMRRQDEEVLAEVARLASLM